MSADAAPELDWVHLPPGREPESLWDCLHDSYLIRSRSNLWERTVTLDFRSYHLQEHFELPEDWEFQFRFEQVAAVRVFTYQTPTHPEREALEASGRELTREEDYRLSVEAHDRHRLETASWSSFELVLADEDTSFDVLNAEYVQREDGAVTLRLSGMLHSSNWHQLVIRAGNLTVLRNDQESFSLEELHQHGRCLLGGLQPQTARALAMAAVRRETLSAKSPAVPHRHCNACGEEPRNRKPHHVSPWRYRVTLS